METAPLEALPIGTPAPAAPEAVVLLARGGYGDWPERELQRMLEAVRASGRYPRVEGAFVDSGGPHLPRVLEGLLEAGARHILVAPVFVPVDRSLREWLPKILRRWMKKRHVQEARIVLAPALGDHPALGEAVLRALEDAAAGADVRADAPPRDKANDWRVVPPHRYHALLCEGPRCATLGSHELFVHLRERLHERGLSGPQQGVLSVRTSCLFPCNLGPLMVVHPEECWYGALTERAVDRIVDEHFAQGRPVDEYRRPRPRPASRPARRSAASPPEPPRPASRLEASPPESPRPAPPANGRP